jgi:glycolate oxidase FAD binding subunit
MCTSELVSQFQEEILNAQLEKSRLQIVGGDTKAFLKPNVPASLTRLEIGGYQGIVDYQPSELVLTARAGTSLTIINETLAEQGQMLAFEPPAFGRSATLGGVVASGLSGPRRPFAGAVRDFVLGCKIINGQGEVLTFGGQVMKNVAGYDVSRLMAGSEGTLGVILEVSLKVLPAPKKELTLNIAMPIESALVQMVALRRHYLSISAVAYENGFLRVRYSGSKTGILSVLDTSVITDVDVESSQNYWHALKEQQVDFFHTKGDLWRISVPPATPVLSVPGHWFYDWAGGLRWLKTAAPVAAVFGAATARGGTARLFRSSQQAPWPRQEVALPLARLNKRVKAAFDPSELFV